MTRKCRTCGEEKELVTGFYAREDSKDGYTRKCRSCIVAKSREAQLRKNEPCKVEGCEQVARAARGMCFTHYQRWVKYGSTDVMFRNRHPDRSSVCAVEECSLPMHAKGFCSSHFYRFDKFGDPLAGSAIIYRGEWGPWKVNYFGYVDRHRTVGGRRERQLQHRYVMQEFLGRELLSHENVHHKNGDRADNRLENLELWSESQPSGQRVIDKLTWAREIVALYGGKR